MSDIDDFDLDRTIDEGWEQFAGQLSEVLAVMDEGAELTLATLDEPQQRQVAFRSPKLGTITVELRGTEGLDRTALAAAGWPQELAGTWSQDDTDALAGQVIRTLRDVVGVTHPVFLTADDPAGLLRPPAPKEEWGRTAGSQVEVSDGDAISVMAGDKAELEAIVAQELTSVFGHDPVLDSDGDYAVRVGSTMVFVRVVPDCREIIVFAALVHDISGRSRAAEVLNDLNAESRWVRFAMIRDRVFGSISVLAKPFVPAHLRQAVRELASVADAIDENLAETLRGRTTF